MTNDEVLQIIEEAKRDGRTKLSLVGQDLCTLPAEIGQLTNLTELWLHHNQLRSVPAELGQLTNLVELYLFDNQLTSVPAELGKLTNLNMLSLFGNQLTSVPAELGQLTNLKQLWLYNNQLTSVPAALGNLTNLTELHLDGNQLTSLPAELGQLTNLTLLKLDGNPWSGRFADLAKGPVKDLLAYLRSLLDGQPQYEAKVLLVGEGGVGKSCLLAALRGEPFEKDRDTTHGIEIKQVESSHPDAAVEAPLKLNFWDFGGQEVYRITHQFFFSRDALYLLVWRPREGQEENAIAGWLERIRLRVGDSARVLIVATHCKERYAELDYPALQAKFGDLLVDHCQVDSKDGTGIDELLTQIAETAAGLKDVGTAWNESWLAARDELVGRDETHVSYRQFEDVCRRHKMDATDTRVLIRLMHTAGHVVYYDSDGLRDFVVLKPEWLTKAISYVLEDRATREAAGLLEHGRLADVWLNHGRENDATYDPEYYPFFLRLMEHYDVSYRLDERDASLVAQMVPFERATFAWKANGGELSLVCRMKSEPPGLVAWMTVRNYRWTTNTHWRSGVFLRHEDGHEGLLDLTGPREFVITVRGAWPSHFMGLLRDGLERLIDERWPHLEYDLFVPCPTVGEDGKVCTGVFKLATLFHAQEKQLADLACHDCLEPLRVADLLTGYMVPKIGLDERLEGLLREQHEAVITKLDVGLQEASQERRELAAKAADMTRSVLRAFVDEARNGPRLFSVVPLSGVLWDPRRLFEEMYKLTLWCEHPGHEHACRTDGQYTILESKKWLTKIGPYVSLVGKALRVAAPIAAGAAGMAAAGPAGAAAGAAAVGFGLKEIKAELDLMEKVTGALLKERGPSPVIVFQGRQGIMTSLEDAASLRSLHELLNELDPKKKWGGLRCVTTQTGDLLWVCPEHYPIYDPGLPDLSPKK